VWPIVSAPSLSRVVVGQGRVTESIYYGFEKGVIGSDALGRFVGKNLLEGVRLEAEKGKRMVIAGYVTPLVKWATSLA